MSVLAKSTSTMQDFWLLNFDKLMQFMLATLVKSEQREVNLQERILGVINGVVRSQGHRICKLGKSPAQ